MLKSHGSLLQKTPGRHKEKDRRELSVEGGKTILLPIAQGGRNRPQQRWEKRLQFLPNGAEKKEKTGDSSSRANKEGKRWLLIELKWVREDARATIPKGKGLSNMRSMRRRKKYGPTLKERESSLTSKKKARAVLTPLEKGDENTHAREPRCERRAPRA